MKRELLVFLGVGSANFVIDFVTYLALLEAFRLPVEVSKGVAFVIGTIFAYFANKGWTFKLRAGTRRSWPRFLLLYGVSLVINISVNTGVLQASDGAELGMEAAFVIATAASAISNFVGMKFFVFSRRVGG